MTIHANTPVYTDFSQLAALKGKAGSDPDGALKQVAKQFESIFINMMMKSMRDATFGDELFGSQQNELYYDMLDKQLALEISSHNGLGIADAMVRQLAGANQRGHVQPAGEGLPLERDRHTITTRSHHPALDRGQMVNQVADEVVEQAVQSIHFDSPEAFVERLMPYARKAAAAIGLDPKVMIAQAALETGWGQKIIRLTNGDSSNNLFNIKADGRWDGERTVINTLEYRQGVALMERAAFRAYPSLEHSFEDYTRFISESPRYGKALQQAADPAAYLEALQQAGYATDPEYANKIKDILSRNLL